MSPSDAAPRSRVRLTGTTEPLTAVHARSGPVVFDLTDGRAQGWTVFQIPSTPWTVVPLAVHPSSSCRSSAAPQEARTAPPTVLMAVACLALPQSMDDEPA